MTSESSLHPQSASRESGSGTPKVVVGIDGSHASLAAMELAAQEAALRDAALQVIMTWDWPVGFARTPMLHEADPVKDTREEFGAAIAALEKGHPDITITAEFSHGHPVPALIEASKQADLLVVGSHGHGRFVGMVVGSVSQHCAALAHCPVLICRNRE